MENEMMLRNSYKKEDLMNIEFKISTSSGLKAENLNTFSTYNVTRYHSFVELRAGFNINPDEIPILPSFNSENVTLDIPAPLSGLGLMHYTNDEQYGGCIKPFLKTLHFKHLLQC
jgi:hypothetical protein